MINQTIFQSFFGKVITNFSREMTYLIKKTICIIKEKEIINPFLRNQKFVIKIEKLP